MISKPFFSLDDRIETLEALPYGADEGATLVDENLPSDDGSVIEEREGVHYISEDVLNPDHEAGVSLNRDFKKLVDSIIK